MKDWPFPFPPAPRVFDSNEGELTRITPGELAPGLALIDAAISARLESLGTKAGRA